ncbi:MAG: alpha/beta hydrolase [Tildeniella nuda ZEHNDER 1965/U140]|jgi:pimeloyl-ACP methyl ester carboxylesterase|nr:alpha/beta hydrolase [Tildeniella nuda ZEHNDER 1965/U140]
MDVWVDEFKHEQPQTVPGFFVRSTAPINIEQDECKPDGNVPTVSDIVESLYQNTKLNTSYTGLVIQIHGYNTGIETVVQNGKEVEGRDYVCEGWQRTWEYLNQSDQAIYSKRHSFVYLGYRWPSESVPSSFKNAGRALPLTLKVVLWGGLFLAAIGLLLLMLFASPILDALSAILMILGIAVSMVVVTLFILRIIVYFRDTYRANNFGVPDLVEFIRQLDLGLVKRHMNESLFETVAKEAGESLDLAPDLLAKAVRKTWEAIEHQPALFNAYDDAAFRLLLPALKQNSLAPLDDAVFLKIYTTFVLAEKPAYNTANFAAATAYWTQKKRIRLTFIGHSMGGFVTTQVIRILSDAFDPAAIGDSQSLEKLPSSDVGRVFALGRLILISPDIPLSTIISGRTNVLRSSLRRFEEAYLFSNEGDLALRLASTTANYFSFPASTRTQGFRLGNVTVNLDPSKQSLHRQNAYGIVNLQELMNDAYPSPLLDFIGVQTLDRDTRSIGQEGDKKREALKKRGGKVDEESLATAKKDPESIADLFTYLDCTEYRDVTTYAKRDQQEINVLICEGQRSPLKFFDYTTLLKAYVDFSNDPGKGVGVDVHGGYFYGRLSNLLIYRLAFLGFQGLLDSLVFQPPIELAENSDMPLELRAKLQQALQLPNEQRRIIAVECLSWLCEKRKIQVAASPERYYVDVLGFRRGETRAQILTQAQVDPAPPAP